MVNASLLPSEALLRRPPVWFPVGGTLEGYAAAMRTQGPHLLTSLAVALGVVAVTLAVAAPAGYALALLRPRGGTALVLVLLLVQMVPGIVMANALYAVFNRAGLVDSHLGLVLADSTLAVPFAVLLLRTFMLAVPRELAEAARVDGAGHWRTFVSVVLPVSRNGVVTAGLFAFLFAWADFLFAVTLTTGREFQPVTVGIYRFIGNQTTDWNGVLATAVLASVPAAFLLVLAQRHVAAGITGGAVKQ
ncbi:ABC transporter permease [Marinitenerispora sediminis]|uniref:ABC transporter permease n=2 Tax=Marinitenerispora sediminis TaxID=1931232 RepID=A0A368SYU4_9ACTN|nr:ABC transporter permease [Marinitenerispora sediminis]RCV51578.1 ABC transporter permease [Marinitenerispora sediminis]RCV52144.1 ABC transporter permease [Marinitenerispora sediminis]